MAAPNLKSLSDLKGKRIAVIEGTVWDWFSQQALNKGALIRKDVTLVNYGSPVDYIASALRGEVDAAWFWETNYTKASQILGPQGWHCLATRADVAPMSAIDGHGPLPINIKSAQEKPDAIAGALRAYKRAGDWCQANVDKCSQAANRLMGAPVPEAKALIPDFGWYVGTSDKYIPLMEDMKTYAVERGFIPKDKDYKLADKLVFGPARQAFPDGSGELAAR